MGAPKVSTSMVMQKGSLMHSTPATSHTDAASVANCSASLWAAGQKTPVASIISTVIPVTTAATGGRSTCC